MKLTIVMLNDSMSLHTQYTTIKLLLQGPESTGSVQICVVLNKYGRAPSSFANLLQGGSLLSLLHHFVSSGTMKTLPSVHAIVLQVVC